MRGVQEVKFRCDSITFEKIKSGKRKCIVAELCTDDRFETLIEFHKEETFTLAITIIDYATSKSIMKIVSDVSYMLNEFVIISWQ